MTSDPQARKLVQQNICHRLEPGWHRDLRKGAWEAYTQLPEVTWEKSDIRKRATGPFPAAQPDVACPDEFELESHFEKGPNRLVYANTRKVQASVQADLAKKGVFFGDLSIALRLFPKWVKPYIAQLIPPQTNKWVAMQTALWNAGLFLYVPKNMQIKIPLQAWWHRTVGGGRNLHPRLLVVAEENSEVTLLTGEVSQLQEPAFSIQVTEVYAKPNARVRIASLQEQDAKMTRLGYARARVERDAQVDWVLAEAGTGTSIADLTSELIGDGARSTITSLSLGTEQQHLDLTQRVLHRGRYTESRIRGNSILTDQARTVYRAVSLIEKGAVGTNSTQEERMILLSHTAQAHLIPMLLIADEDVRCDHAVSVGKLPADQLFYLMARGLTEAQAKLLLLRGFLTPLIESLPIAGFSATVDAWTERKIPL